MLNRPGYVDPLMDPTKLEHQRQTVRTIRSKLPQFDYDAHKPIEDHNDFYTLITRPKTTMYDKEVYDGQWSKDTGLRHGRG